MLHVAHLVERRFGTQRGTRYVARLLLASLLLLAMGFGLLLSGTLSLSVVRLLRVLRIFRVLRLPHFMREAASLGASLRLRPALRASAG